MEHFIHYCSAGNIEMVQKYIEDGTVDPQYANNEPLREAIRNKHYSVARLLLSQRTVLQDTKNLFSIMLEMMERQHRNCSEKRKELETGLKQDILCFAGYVDRRLENNERKQNSLVESME
jgi:hypothetical protein